MISREGAGMDERDRGNDESNIPGEAKEAEMSYTEEELAAMEEILERRKQYPLSVLQAHLSAEELQDTKVEDHPDYDRLPDEEIISMCHQGNYLAEEYLLNKYKNLVRSKARSYFLIGADHEDIVQEGMIGLYKAIRDFKQDRQATFRAFAELCITRQIITAIKTATRQKHIPLNSYVSLNKPIYDEDSDRTLMDVIVEGHATNPEDLLIGQEDIDSINDHLDTILSPLERDALSLYLDGKSYQEIASDLGRHAKSIDNALQRVKRKLLRFLEEQQLSVDEQTGPKMTS